MKIKPLFQLTTLLLFAGPLCAGAATHYVDLGSANPTPPYASWGTAAHMIQDAIDAAVAGDEVVVTNGLYATGGRVAAGSALTNRVLVDKSIVVRSVNGASVTTIRGYQVAGTTNGDSAIRCVYLAGLARLSGFTLTNGATRNVVQFTDNFGGAVYSLSSNSVISDCILSGNSALSGAGGAYYGTLTNCWLIGNQAQSGGGVYDSTLYNCVLTNNTAATSGGGAYGAYYGASLYDCLLVGNRALGYSGGGAQTASLSNCVLLANTAVGSAGGAGSCVLQRCILRGNSAAQGGGLSGGSAFNCLLTGNWATDSGGGAYGPANLYNCTLAGNSATNYGGGGYGFDSFHIHANCNLYNSIIYSNTAAMHSDCECTQYDSCLPASDSGIGSGNIYTPPQFVNPTSGNFRLRSTSPCINAGNNSWLANFPSNLDLDGNPRVFGGIVDMGAYEFQFGSSLASLWTLTSAPRTNWSAVASSANGAKLVAVVKGGLIYVSTNSGDAWAAASAPSNQWTAVASSADGMKLIAAVSGGPVFFSTNSGDAWIQAALPVKYWTSVAMSADGARLAAVLGDASTQQVMYVSSDSAATWSEVAPPTHYLSVISFSADGTKWVLASSSFSFSDKQNVFISTNYGVNWRQTDGTPQNWHSASSSADGRRIAVAPRGRPCCSPVTFIIPEPISLSSDFGFSWNATTATDDWTGVASSADGSELIGVTYGSIRSSAFPDGGFTYISTNFGASWITNIVPHASWTGVAASADGASVVAVAGTESWGDSPAPGIYVLRTIPSPVLLAKASADELSLSWIVPSLKFVLQQNSGLQAANWSDVTATPVLNTTNLHYEVTVPRADAMKFYRLRSH